MIQEITLYDFFIKEFGSPLYEFESGNVTIFDQSFEKIIKNFKVEEHIFGDSISYTMFFLSFLSKSKTVFEFGTFRGQTTYNLSIAADEVYTIDLGSNTSDDEYSDYLVGDIYKKNNATNVNQLIGDSLTYDFNKLYNKFDLVWIDAGHSYEACKKDFETSIKLIKQNVTSIIAIDDYPTWSGVKQAVEEIAETKHLYYIPEITTVVYINKP